MSKIFYLPLEHIDMRYTTHMDRDIKKYLINSKKQFISIEPEIKNIDSKPPEGCFLNAPFTTAFKSMQIAKLAEYFYNGEVEDGDEIFVSDIWFPGLESIAYMCYFMGINVKINGILHAGSFTDTDSVRDLERWAKNFEDIIFDICDTIFVGSEFIKCDVIKKRFVNPDKIKVTGLPLDYLDLDKYLNDEKEDIVVFNGRNHSEKQPWLFKKLEEVIKEDAAFKNVKFVTTFENDFSKPEYYTLLSKAKCVVSYALQENFGFGIAEAAYLGCVPVVPNSLVYPEFYDIEYLYNDFNESVEKVKQALNNKLKPVNVNLGKTSIQQWFGDE